MEYSEMTYEQKLDMAKTLLQQLALMPYPRHLDHPELNLTLRIEAQDKIDLAVMIIERLEGILENA